MVKASLHQQKEEVKLRSLYVLLSFKICDHFKCLDQSEVLLSFVLHPEGATPHVDPRDVDVSAHFPAHLEYIDFVPRLYSLARAATIDDL